MAVIKTYDNNEWKELSGIGRPFTQEEKTKLTNIGTVTSYSKEGFTVGHDGSYKTVQSISLTQGEWLIISFMCPLSTNASEKWNHRFNGKILQQTKASSVGNFIVEHLSVSQTTSYNIDAYSFTTDVDVNNYVTVIRLA